MLAAHVSVPCCLRQTLPLVLLAGMLGLSACSEKRPDPLNRTAMPTVALLSDFGWKDSYVAEMKGALLSVNPAVNLVDLSHDIDPYNVAQAAYLIDQMAKTFPPGTVFVGVVDPGAGTTHTPLLLQTGAGKFYLGPDNGIFTLVLQREGFHQAWKLNNSAYFSPASMASTFHGRDVFAPAAGHLVNGVAPGQLGDALNRSDLSLPGILQPILAGANIIAEVIHIDRFGNVLTNLPRGFTPLLQEGKLAQITVNKQKHTTPLVKTFSDVKPGRLFLLYGSQGVLEIAQNQGSAAETLKAKVGDKVTIKP